MRIADLVFVWQLHDERQIAWHGRRHSHGGDLHEIHYFISGAGSFRNGRHTWTIEAGSLHLSPPGMVHQIAATGPRRPITYYALLLDGQGDPELAALLGRLEEDERPRGLGTARRFFFADVLERQRSGREAEEAAARHLVLAFLWDLAAGQEMPRDVADNVHVERALAVIQGAIDSPLELAALASRVGVSREHLSRVFTARMGMPPMRYHARLRVEAARAMLAGTSLKVAEISERLRYSSQFNFARAFRSETGMSPSEYRGRCLEMGGLGGGQRPG